MEIIKQYRVVIIILVAVLILVIIRSTGYHFKSDALKLAEPSVMHIKYFNIQSDGCTYRKETINKPW